MAESKWQHEIQQLYQYLRDCYESGVEATYTEMARLIGWDAVTSSTYPLTLALQSAKQDGMLFCNVAGVGYRPLKQTVAYTVTHNRTQKTKRNVDRWQSELNAASAKAQSTEELMTVTLCQQSLNVQRMTCHQIEASMKEIPNIVKTPNPTTVSQSLLATVTAVHQEQVEQQKATLPNVVKSPANTLWQPVKVSEQ